MNKYTEFYYKDDLVYSDSNGYFSDLQINDTIYVNGNLYTIIGSIRKVEIYGPEVFKKYIFSLKYEL